MRIMNIKDANKLKAYVGGYTGSSYELVIDFENKKAEYKAFDYGYTPAGKYSIDISEDNLEQLLQDLYEVKLLQWEKTYADPGILDGTSWSVKVYFKSGSFESSGTNAYPKKWGQFCDSLERLTGHTFR